MRRFTSRQLTVLLLAAMLCLAVPATTVAAGIAKVQISDARGKAAKVKAGRLQVDAAGTVRTVPTGTTTTQVAPPSDFVHVAREGLSPNSCEVMITAPANADLVITQFRANVYTNPNPGAGRNAGLYAASNCGDVVASGNPPGIGHVTIPLDPGYGLPAGTSLYVAIGTGMQAELFVDGYRVPKGSVS